MKTRIVSRKPEAKAQEVLRPRETFFPAPLPSAAPEDDGPAERVERAERFGHHLGRLRPGSAPPPSPLLPPFGRGSSGPAQPVIQRSTKKVNVDDLLKDEDEDKIVIEENLEGEDLFEEEEDSPQAAFGTALLKGDFETAAQLLSGGKVDLNHNGGQGPPLYRFTLFKNTAAVAFLLKQEGVDLDETGPDDRTPLHVAVAGGLTEIIDLLLERDVDVNTADEDDNTPLHLAVSRGEMEVVSKLLAKGAKVNAKGEDGNTPLHVALSQENQEMVQLLLKHGADMSVRNEEEKAPLETVEGESGPELRKTLRGSYPEELRQAFVKGFQQLLAEVPPISVKVFPKESPGELGKKLDQVVTERFEQLKKKVAQLLAGSNKKLAKIEIDVFGSHWKGGRVADQALKFLAHVHSLSGSTSTGYSKLDLEGFSSKDALRHSILALQSSSNRIASEEESGKQALALGQRIEVLIRSFQRRLDFDFAKSFFKDLGLESALPEIQLSLGQAVSTQEAASGAEFVLPVGYAGKEMGHAVYLAGQGNFQKGEGELSIHNLGELSQHHPPGEQEGELSSIYPVILNKVSSGEDLTKWLTAAIRALMEKESAPAEEALYGEGSGKLGEKVGREEIAKRVDPQTQQTVGNCSVENLNNFLLASLQTELGLEEGAILYRKIKGHVQEYAKQQVESLAKKNKGLGESLDTLLLKDVPQKQLLDAVRKGDLKTMQTVLQESPKIDLEATDDQKRTPLQIALANKNAKAALLLLQKGAALTEKVRELLVGDVLVGGGKLVSVLLENGLDPNGDFYAGLNLLQAAVTGNTSPEVIEQLLKAKADVNAAGGNAKKTPLHWAAEEKKTTVAELLLKYGADRGAKDAKGKLPYELALEAGDKDLAELLKPESG